jgi:beta-lactam-binding protein with PASTA domain
LLRGSFRDRLDRPQRPPAATPWRPNLVVWSALDLIGALLCNRSAGLTYLAVGAGDPEWDANPPPPDRGRRQLTAEVFRVRLERGDSLAYDPATGRVRVSVSIGRGKATGKLRELGLFGGGASARPDSGLLVNHAVHPAIEKGEGETLRRELFLTLEPALAPGARDLIGGLLARREGLAGITHVALGTSGDAPTEPPRDLLAEAYRKPLPPGALVYDAPAHAVEAVAEFDLGEGPEDVREAGLLGGTATETADTGSLVARDTGAAVDRRLPQRLERRFRLVLVADTGIGVPALVGGTLDAARAALAAAELQAGPVSVRESAADPAGNVLEQSPASGAAVNEGTPVALVVAGPPTVVVPEIIGEPADQATALLEALGLDAPGDDRVEQPSTEPEGTVLAAVPSPGTRVPEGTDVALTVASPVQVAVPDVRGRTPESASLVLRVARLRLAGDPAVEESSASAGTIVAQDPVAGAAVAAGSEVTVTLATPWTVEIPNLVRKTTDDAPGLLAKAAAPLIARLGLPDLPGLALGAVSERADAAPAGTILVQTPLAGSRASLYATVNVVVSASAPHSVPQLVGLTQSAAVAAVAAAGFSVGRTLARASEDAPPGTVVDQDPAAGVPWPSGGRLSMTVAATRTVSVPDVLGLALDAAREAITGRGLVVGDTTTQVEPGLPGTVFEQDPLAQELAPPGSGVNLVIRAGVPNVVGMTGASAEAAIAAAGITLGDVEAIESDGPAGIVLKQDPAAGTAVDPTTRMTLVVSVARGVDVPEIVGKSLDDATRAIGDAGLVLVVADKTESDEAEGSILAQDPVAGTHVALGSTVSVTIAITAPKVVAVPQIVKLTQEQAKAALDAVGLELQVAGQRAEPDFAPGTVVVQKPGAGEMVDVGTQVAVLLASADQTVEVPEVRHRSVADATALLGAASLKLLQSDTAPSVEPSGAVLSQDPIPGSRVPSGSVVSVVVSAGGMVMVPDVVGLSQPVATGALAKLKLATAALNRTDLTHPPGTVIAQDPAGGTAAAIGSTVRIVVAQRGIIVGGHPPFEDVPQAPGPVGRIPSRSIPFEPSP